MFLMQGELCTRSNLYIFQLNDDDCEQEELEDEENLAASNNWLLPSAEFQGLWENLVYDDNIKTNVNCSYKFILYLHYMLKLA